MSRPTPSAAEVVASLSLAEKASLLSGADFWNTQGIERDGEPQVSSILLTDGPHGLRKQTGGVDHLGLGDSVPATCFPPAVAMGSSFDADLVARVATAIAAEAHQEGVAVVLGPGINLKRSPLCGRNFEYFSEDPLLSGLLGTAYVEALQAAGVGASLKHFAVNNQEHERLRVSAEVDERTLRELYLRSFERVVRRAKPWTVMCSYNRINGVHASQDPWLLTEVLRGEWGFDGLVVSDWGAVVDRVAGVAAGLDLEMPACGGITDAEVVAAVEQGRLDEQFVDRAAERVVALVQRAAAARDASPATSEDWVERHHALAREAAARCVVLLRNEPADGAPLLPLQPGARVAVIGDMAVDPRYQGAGSSRINPTRIDNARDALVAALGSEQVTSAGNDRVGAARVAAAADVAVVFLGLPPEAESEGFDRSHIDLPPEHLALLDAVLDVQPRTVVVLSNGGVVALPFAERVPAIVEGWVLGQAGGSALADVLTGAVNPSGRLAETIPLRLADTPAFLDFGGERLRVRHGEGVFVGYRWYDARDMPVRYPFGHGLSYTTFDYAGLRIDVEGDEVVVRAEVTNTGPVDGREVVQAYVGLADSHLARPPREFAGVAVVEVPAGGTVPVEIRIARDDLARWFAGLGWRIEAGEYDVHLGASSRDLRLHGSMAIQAEPIAEPLHLESTVAEVLANPVAGPLVAAGLAEFEGASGEVEDVEGMAQMMLQFPIGRVVKMSGGMVAAEDVMALLEAANAETGP
ncbi:glycoside hydrolase family 3 C-terminal domain-containing protein [Nocardioides sp. AE5]|uniref:glycoside hydrolase family 3 C-terminal domain-containing protein n=1 Tax=Nocardioides sp. AE5 TaxID=2962573 RepID=UPI002881793F|nr:glycoside hydrolase family 3 C-terminal domain-containing protein [Nocardioides sp. AE5]MDT0201928.1 glycoside hydrolase family 3 C-terminal domain-containing protein [Nocardioides sp. AE5]